MTLSAHTTGRTMEIVVGELTQTREVLAKLEREQKDLGSQKAEALVAGEVEKAALSGKPLPKDFAKMEQRTAELPALIEAMKLRAARLGEERLEFLVAALNKEHHEKSGQAFEKLEQKRLAEEDYRLARDEADAARIDHLEAQRQLGIARRWRARLEHEATPGEPVRDPSIPPYLTPEQHEQMQAAVTGEFWMQ